MPVTETELISYLNSLVNQQTGGTTPPTEPTPPTPSEEGEEETNGEND